MVASQTPVWLQHGVLQVLALTLRAAHVVCVAGGLELAPLARLLAVSRRERAGGDDRREIVEDGSEPRLRRRGDRFPAAMSLDGRKHIDAADNARLGVRRP